MNRNPKYLMLLIFIMIFIIAGCKKHEEIIGDTTPPVISGVRLWVINDYKVRVLWDTDEPATSQVEYGTSEQYGSETVEDLNLVVNHEVVLENIIPRILCYFRVKSRDEANNLSIGSNHKFGSGITL